MRVLTGVNDLLAFVLELIMLGLLGWWGFARGGNIVLSVVAGLGAPALAALAWGTFAAPRAWIALPTAAVLVVKVVIFGAATAALAALGHRNWAVAFAVVVVANLTIALTLKP